MALCLSVALMEANRQHRIIRVAATPVSVPRIAPLKSALGVSSNGSFGIVEVETDGGIVGLGEISMIWNGDGAALCPMVNQLLGPALIGRSAFDINAAHLLMNKAVQFSRAANPAKAAIDMALYDIVGKALSTPVYNLLGGRVRDAAPLSMSIMIAPLDEMVAQARNAIDRGFAGVKVKVGIDLVHDIEFGRGHPQGARSGGRDPGRCEHGLAIDAAGADAAGGPGADVHPLGGAAVAG